MRTTRLALLLLAAWASGCGGLRVVRHAAPAPTKPVPRLAVPSKSGSTLRGFAFGGDGRWLATAGDGGMLRLWDATTGVELRRFAHPNAMISGVALSRDGRRVAAQTWGRVSAIRVFDVPTGALLVELFGDPLGNGAFTLDASGRRLAHVTEAGGVEVFDLELGERTANVVPSEPLNMFTVDLLALDDAGAAVTAWTKEGGQIIDLASGAMTQAPGASPLVLPADAPAAVKAAAAEVERVEVSPNGALVATLTRGGELVRVLELGTGAERFRLATGGRDPQLRFSRDGKLLIHDGAQAIGAWDLTTGAHHTLARGDLTLLHDVAWAMENAGGTLRLVELAGERRASLPVGGRDVGFVQVDEARGRVAVALGDELVLWELGGRELWRRALGEKVLQVAFAKDGAKLVATTAGRRIVQLDAAAGSVLAEAAGPGDVGAVGLSPEGSVSAWGAIFTDLALVQSDGGAKLGTLEETPEFAMYPTQRFSDDGRHLYGAALRDRSVLVVHDTATARRSKRIEVRGGEVLGLAISPDERWVAAACADGSIHVLDLKQDRDVLTLAALDGGDWVAATPDGRFDGSPGGTAKVAWVSGEQVTRLDGTFERYYTPRLVALALGGVEAHASAAFAELPSFGPAPEVELLAPKPNAVVRGDSVEVRVRVKDTGGGVDEVRVMLGGKVLGGDTRGLKRTGEELTFTVALAPGDNELSASAFARDRTESTPVRVLVRREATPATARLWVLAVGIDQYVNPKLRLNYGRGDAEAMVKAIQAHGARIFGSIEVELLVDQRATREAIEAAFAKVAKGARPEDAFVFFYAGHGVMSEPKGAEKGDFYLVPADVVQLYGKDDVLAARGIGAARLRELVTSVGAEKQLLLLDACQSGGAVERFAMRGAAEEKAIAQLARAAGIAVLAASGTEQFATEVKALGHGVFTYALLEGLEGAADGGAAGDGKVTVKELEAFLEDRVPELTAKHRGEKQFPSSYSRGRDFPLGLVR